MNTAHTPRLRYLLLLLAMAAALSACSPQPPEVKARPITAWKLIDGGGEHGLNSNPERDTYFPQLMAFNSKLYITWREMGEHAMQLHVAVFNGDEANPQWKFVDRGAGLGVNHDPAQDAFDPQFAVFNSKLYMSWQEENGTAYQVRVAVYNGDDEHPAWRFVDGDTINGINLNPKLGAGYAQMREFNSKLYIIWEEFNPDIKHIRVAVYNGDDAKPAWKLVNTNPMIGLNSDPTQAGFQPHLAVAGNTLYATWNQKATQGSHIHVSAYNGNDAQPLWRIIDGKTRLGLNKTPGSYAAFPHLASYDSRLYLTWQEPGAGGNQMRVVTFNGDLNHPEWRYVDGGGETGINFDPTKAAYTPQLAVHENTLFATWYEANSLDVTQVRVRQYNGNDAKPQWQFVDGGGSDGINHDHHHQTFDPQLLSFNSKLYATWKEINGSGRHQVRVAVAQQ